MTALHVAYTAETPQELTQELDRLRDVWRENRLSSRGENETLTLLELTMEELPGTTWRNVHTIEPHRVRLVAENRFGQIGPDPDAISNATFSIGLWRSVGFPEPRFCIETWIRVDHLSSQLQIDWAVERIRHCNKEISGKQRTLDKAKADRLSGANIRLCESMIEHAENRLRTARAELVNLARELGLPEPTDLLNVGACAGQQLALM